MNRREFIQQTAIVAATTASMEFTAEAKVNWPIGCFNRPWTKWSFDETLKQIKDAGYKSTGLLSRHREELFIRAEATPEYLENLKKRLAASGLTSNMGALSSSHNIPLEDSIRDVRKQIDNAKFLSLKYVMSFGANNPEEFGHYYKVMSDASAYAQEKGVKLVMKPHGGISGSADEILRVIKEVNHRNFSIWYDAGNIIHYTGKDPVAEIEPIARHITGFCAKDCGELRGDVMIQFGAGKVDFAGVFKRLKAGGFDGPVMVECCKVGATPEETTANARANREFLEKALASV
ncbi:MAG TPA: sugar phosphate isomerase/epimerase family protein [Blastocatellia bacterium]|nr:sugar phosphate isomerase/epimerase family protein [Blastocatellia bacterium]